MSVTKTKLWAVEVPSRADPLKWIPCHNEAGDALFELEFALHTLAASLTPNARRRRIRNIETGDMLTFDQAEAIVTYSLPLIPEVLEPMYARARLVAKAPKAVAERP